MIKNQFYLCLVLSQNELLIFYSINFIKIKIKLIKNKMYFPEVKKDSKTAWLKTHFPIISYKIRSLVFSKRLSFKRETKRQKLN